MEKQLIKLISILTGKKGRYNRLILEVLAENPNGLKAWDIAKEIWKRLKVEEDWYRGAQRIYSLLIRKGGRLEELESKEYIVSKENKWQLTEKGLITVLVMKPEFKSKYKEEIGAMVDKFLKEFNKIKAVAKDNRLLIELLDMYISIVKTGLEDLDFVIDEIVKNTRKLIMSGVNLDLIPSNNVFLLILTYGEFFEDIKKIFSKKLCDNFSGDRSL